MFEVFHVLPNSTAASEVRRISSKFSVVFANKKCHVILTPMLSFFFSLPVNKVLFVKIKICLLQNYVSFAGKSNCNVNFVSQKSFRLVASELKHPIYKTDC